MLLPPTTAPQYSTDGGKRILLKHSLIFQRSISFLLKVTISSLFRLTHTFTIKFGSPSTSVFSSVPAIAFS